jgi:hypothetical protein
MEIPTAVEGSDDRNVEGTMFFVFVDDQFP